MTMALCDNNPGQSEVEDQLPKPAKWYIMYFFGKSCKKKNFFFFEGRGPQEWIAANY